MYERDLDYHHHVGALLESPFILSGGLPLLDTVSHRASAFGGEEGALTFIVVKELLAPALKALVSSSVIDDSRAGALARDHQHCDGGVTG